MAAFPEKFEFGDGQPNEADNNFADEFALLDELESFGHQIDVDYADSEEIGCDGCGISRSFIDLEGECVGGMTYSARRAHTMPGSGMEYQIAATTYTVASEIRRSVGLDKFPPHVRKIVADEFPLAYIADDATEFQIGLQLEFVMGTDMQLIHDCRISFYIDQTEILVDEVSPEEPEATEDEYPAIDDADLEGLFSLEDGAFLESLAINNGLDPNEEDVLKVFQDRMDDIRFSTAAQQRSMIRNIMNCIAVPGATQL